MERIITASLNNSIAAKQAFVRDNTPAIIRLAQWIIAVFQQGGKIMIFGNGGSAADAQHLAAEFVNRFLLDRPPLPAIALCCDPAVLTSIGNDFSFDDIFAKQIRALGRPEDLALGISTSGNSPNVVKAIRTARNLGLKTAALTGAGGGELQAVADLLLKVPAAKVPHIQETHIWVEHLLCEIVEETLFGDNRGLE